MPHRTILAVCLLLAASLTGCSSDTDQYCGTLKQDQTRLKQLVSASGRSGTDVLPDTLAMFKDLREKSPEDIRDEWDTMVFSWQTLAGAFRTAGVDPAHYRPGATQGVTHEQDRAIQQAAAELGSMRVLDASRGIEQQAHDICHVDLGL
jgi:hypothetical protein